MYSPLGIGVTSLPNKTNDHQDTVLWSLLQLSLICLLNNTLQRAF